MRQILLGGVCTLNCLVPITLRRHLSIPVRVLILISEGHSLAILFVIVVASLISLEISNTVTTSLKLPCQLLLQIGRLA